MQLRAFLFKFMKGIYFSDNLNKDLPHSDIVYSLGFNDHFEDLPLVVKITSSFLSPGGTRRKISIIDRCNFHKI
jgi:hypothetical protein